MESDFSRVYGLSQNMRGKLRELLAESVQEYVGRSGAEAHAKEEETLMLRTRQVAYVC